ncbi:hypothetical protein [Kineosporia sp. NBRC 101731]|uniref:hypothetical protein n=1 Tax=Kineosporia sp. NBRC 101731 TaxID=3032199 RepID=UPI0024A47094|nr:hypothetical protein [Kineosporia sp. NBRC 101731]GLY27271.1 hypothetical protein Kisp02_06360 [Kineosporia sp. NBRC 101731]
MTAARRGLYALLATASTIVLFGCATAQGTQPDPAATLSLAFVAVCQDPTTRTILTDGYCLGGHPDATWRFYSASLYREVGASAFDAGQKTYGGLTQLPRPDASTDIEVRWGRHARTVARLSATSPVP